MNKELLILEARIERAIKELIHLDVTIAQASGRVSIGMTDLRSMSNTLKDNAYRAIHEPITFVPKALLRGKS